MKTPTIALISAALLTACGGSSSDNQPDQASFNLGISDAPVDAASEVVLYFNEVVLVPQDGSEPILVDVSEEDESGRIDLLDFQGGDQHPLIKALSVPPGNYTMCLYVLDGDGSSGLSYVNHADQGIVPLKVNSKGSCSGQSGSTEAAGRIFFNQTFTLNVGENNFVAEFNLRKGLVDPRGQADFFIKPTAVQLVNTIETGTLAGFVNTELMNNCIADLNELQGESDFIHSVYLYANEIQLNQMGDIDNEGGFVEPLAAAPILAKEVNEESTFNYEFGFVSAGSYSIGYTCLAQNDFADQDDLGTEAGQFALYQAFAPIEAVAGQTTTTDL